MTYDSVRLDLFLAHRSALIDYAQPIVGCRAPAEDVVQEAYLRFAAATDRERAADDVILQPAGYLYRIVRNLAVDWARHLAQEAGYTFGADGNVRIFGFVNNILDSHDPTLIEAGAVGTKSDDVLYIVHPRSFGLGVEAYF